MAVDMFLKLQGITGESKDAAHPGEIDVLSWSWGGTQPTSVVGGGLGSAKAAFDHFKFTKYIDISSSTIFSAMATGKHISTATLTLRKAGATPLEYFTLRFTDVVISSYKTGAQNAQAAQDLVTEDVCFAYGKVEMNYTEQASTGGAGNKSAPITWDVKANKAS